MKRIILILVIQTVAFVAFGQTHDAPSYSGNGGYISTGNYGGTGNAAYFPLGIWANGTNSWIYGNVSFGYGSIGDRDNKWSINPAGNSWFNGGKVGIGTTTPVEALHVIGSIRGNQTGGALRVQTQYGYVDFGAQNTSFAHFYTDRPLYYFDKGIRVNGMIGSHSGNLLLGTAGTTWMTINSSNGNVGIGITDPGSYKLNVNGPVYLANGLTSPISTNITLGSSPFEGNLRLRLLHSGTHAYIDYMENLYFRADKNWVSSLILQGDGNVGIGFSTGYDAGHRVTQGYKLAVNGSILCEGVKVIADVPNSDYVFSSDYKLLNLPALEEFVKKNNHLPEVPSADEFKKNGYSVGEMDNLLLKKVEELTLYIIELNKKVNSLEEQNIELKKRLEKENK